MNFPQLHTASFIPMLKSLADQLNNDELSDISSSDGEETYPSAELPYPPLGGSQAENLPGRAA
jgi:hypothetical protein